MRQQKMSIGDQNCPCTVSEGGQDVELTVPGARFGVKESTVACSTDSGAAESAFAMPELWLEFHWLLALE
jgi:hypothetical protein